MGCINTNTPGFKKIADVYGKSLAERFVRGYSKNVKGLTDDFYYPNLTEIKDWLTVDKSRIVNNVSVALEENPQLSAEGIKGLLSGVIHSFNDTLFITTGPTVSPLLIRPEVRDTIFNPHVKIIRELADRFPQIISIRETNNTYRKIIEIRPQEVDQQGVLFSKSGTTSSSRASTKTVSAVKDFLKRIGVNIQSLEQISVNGIKQDANGAAFIMQKLIQVVQGAEVGVLPEEAMHFAVAIIKQTNPALYKKLLSEVNGFKLLDNINKVYGTDPLYRGKDGKPDVNKLKEEAIAKILAEIIINKSEGVTERPELLSKVGGWWRAIIDWFKEKFITSGFDQAAMDILSGKDIGTAEDIREESDKVFLQKDAQTMIFDKLDTVSNSIIKKEDQPNEDDNGYYIGKIKIPRRVTDLIKGWYERRFKDKDLTKSDFQKAIDDLKAEKGTAGHAALEFAFHKLVDTNGYLRVSIEDDSDYDAVFKNFKEAFERDKYEILRDNLEARLKSFKDGTRFKSEVIVHDPTRGVAGTIDFLAVEQSGKTHILDWKFMNLGKKYEDVPWYKVTAWNNQMTQYKLILQNAYGIKSEDFGQTRMIPIQANYSEANAKLNILPKLTDIVIGDVDVKKISQNYLLPVGLESEKTGIKEVDILIEKLNAMYRRFSEKKVLPSDKQTKAEQLNTLFTAIRQLQIKGDLKPLLDQSKILNKQIKATIEKYNTDFKGKDPLKFTEKEINDFAGELQTAQEAIQVYTDLDTGLASLFEEDTPENRALQQDLKDTVYAARLLEKKMEHVLNDYVSDIIAKSEGIDNLLSPEKIIKGITKLFSSTATLQLKSIELLYKKANKAFYYSGVDTLAESKELEELKKNYEVLAAKKGLNKKTFFDLIKKKDKNELIDEHKPEFYKTLRKKIQEKDSTWIKANIDVEAYREHLKVKLAEEIDRIEKRHRVGTAADEASTIKKEIANAEELYSISYDNSPGWLLNDQIKKFPKDIWISDEWKQLNIKGNEAAKDFYDYIIRKNNEYQDLGYINKLEARVFLPFVRKGLTEKLITGGQVRLGEQFFRDISIDEGDIGYGQIDPLTGKTVNVIPKYFTSDITGELSTDLFRTMAFYNEAAIRYKYLSQIEEQIKAIVAVEKTKKAIATSIFGKTDYNETTGELQTTPDNNENSKLVEDMMKAIIYGQRYITSETFDQLLFKMGSWGTTFNKKLGLKIFPEDLEGRQVSVNKIISQLNNTFQLSTLGLNLLSASSNLFGGNSHSMINAGTYFTKTDYIAAEGMIVINKFNGTNHKLMLGALEYFLPLTENYNREVAKRLSLNKLTAESLQDGLMYFMRQSDWNVQTSNFYAYLKNTIVQDGQVLNVREYLRTTDKYKDKYQVTSEQRSALKDEFEKDVNDLIDTQGVLKLATVVDDKFTIPGVDQKSQSVVELRRKVQQISKNALGNLSEDDLRTINMQIYGKSFMVFKNWIPRLVDVRMGNMKYNSASDAYEWGRMRMVFKVLSDDFLGSIGNLKNSLIANEKGVDYMRELFEKKKAEYKKDTGKTLNMTETQFMDLVRSNIKAQLIDVIFMSIMIGMVMALKAYAPPDDEDPAVKSQYRFMVRTFDKFKDELSYFYDPTSFLGLVSKGIFPSISLLDNMTKGTKNFMIENWAISTGNEKLEKSNQVIKYWMKVFPFTNQMIGYLPMFYPELAKDMGVKIQANYGIR